jgi:kynurenine formamidase
MMKTLNTTPGRLLACIIFWVGWSNAPAQQDEPRLWKIVRELKSCRFVDLTHAFAPGIPHWKGFPDEQRTDLFSYEKDGFWAQQFCHIGQWGTHVDPPAHFHKGLRTVDQIPLQEMILPLVVIDVTKEVTGNPDFVLKAGHIEDWEQRHGPIPSGAFVAMRTDWSKRWPDHANMQNADDKGTAHYPGWSLEALQLLLETRAVTAIGHETTDTDPGLSTSKNVYECESYVLKQNRWQIELLANLDQLPARGAMLVCSFPKPKNGSGFPARVFAVVP